MDRAIWCDTRYYADGLGIYGNNGPAYDCSRFFYVLYSIIIIIYPMPVIVTGLVQGGNFFIDRTEMSWGW